MNDNVLRFLYVRTWSESTMAKVFLVEARMKATVLLVLHVFHGASPASMRLEGQEDISQCVTQEMCSLVGLVGESLDRVDRIARQYVSLKETPFSNK